MQLMLGPNCPVLLFQKSIYLHIVVLSQCVFKLYSLLLQFTVVILIVIQRPTSGGQRSLPAGHYRPPKLPQLPDWGAHLPKDVS